MYAGRIVESGPVIDIFKNPQHPYTHGLLRSMPRLDESKGERLVTDRGPAAEPAAAAGRLRLPRPLRLQDGDLRSRDAGAGAVCTREEQGMPSGDAMNVERLPGRGAPLLSVTDLKVKFLIGGGFLSRRPPAVLKAVDGVSFDLRPGETLGLVGESGCGKSTLGRAVLRLLDNVEGRVVWLGQDLSRLDGEGMRQRRKEMQIIFQDPLASLNPRMPIGEIIAEPLKTFFPDTPASEVKARVQGDDGQCRPAAEPDQPLPARILRRPVPAHRHRPRHDQRIPS